ncbi:MAG: hypothetical protein KDC95_11255 [Planctomycetes bacterium]|nr:hypothetical protein [Planctomycetota bacterium]
MDALWWTESLVFSCVGLGYFVYGRKQHHAPTLLIGIALSVVPMLFDDPLAMGGAGLAVLAAPMLLSRALA